MKIDNYGLVVGRKEDAGDSLHRTSMWMLGSYWFKGIIPGGGVKLLQYRTQQGKWMRHPSDGWWSDTDRLSRDQATPLVIALGEFFTCYLLWHFFWSHVKRGFFFTNTRRNGATRANDGQDKYIGHPEDGQFDYGWKVPDFIGLEFLAIYIRAFRAWPLYPLLIIFDIETLIGSIIWRFKDGQTDVLNHVLACHYINYRYPTPAGWLAKRINSRPQFRQKMAFYFDRIGLPDMATLWYDGL